MRDTKHCMLYIRSQTPPIFHPKTTVIRAKQRHAQYIALCADYVGCYECMRVFAFCPLDLCSSSSSYRLILDGFRLRITLVRLLFNRAIEHILCWFKKNLLVIWSYHSVQWMYIPWYRVWFGYSGLIFVQQKESFMLNNISNYQKLFE